MYSGGGNRGRKRGRGEQQSWPFPSGANTTLIYQRPNTYSKPPLLQTYSDASGGYDDRRKQPVANRLGFNWNRACSSLPTYDLDYNSPVDERPPVKKETMANDRIVYGRDERSRSASSSFASDHFGRESRDISDGRWSEEYRDHSPKRSKMEYHPDMQQRFEKMKKQLSDYARDERIYKCQLKEYREELKRSGAEHEKIVHNLKAQLANSVKRKIASYQAASDLKRQLLAKDTEFVARRTEQSKRIAQLEAELLAATKQADFHHREALDQHLSRLKNELDTGSYLPDNMAVLQSQHDKLRTYTSQLETRIAQLKSKVDTVKAEKHGEELKRKECEKKFRREIDVVHAFTGGSVVDKLKKGATAVRLLKHDVDLVRQTAQSMNARFSSEFNSLKFNLLRKVMFIVRSRNSGANAVSALPRDPRKRRIE